MHRFWNVPELVKLVVTHLKRASKRSNADLARLARTAKLFHPVALGQLYASITGKELYALSIILHPVLDAPCSLSLSERVSRFERYAVLVEQITLCGGALGSSHASHILAAFTHISAIQLFSHLRVLSISCFTKSLFEIIPRLVLPSLTRLTLNTRSRDDWSAVGFDRYLASLLFNIRASKCDLIKLKISNLPAAGAETNPELARTLSSLGSLQSLHLELAVFVIGDVFDIIANYKGLRSLNIQEDSAYAGRLSLFCGAGSRYRIYGPYFQKLSTIVFNSSAEDITFLLHAVSGPLTRIALTIQYITDVSSLTRCVRAIAGFSRTLRHLALCCRAPTHNISSNFEGFNDDGCWEGLRSEQEIEDEDEYEDEDVDIKEEELSDGMGEDEDDNARDVHEVPWIVYRSLLACKQLTYLRLKHGEGLTTDLGDVFIKELAKACPLLIHCSISTGSRAIDDENITLNSVSALATNCMNIQTVTLSDIDLEIETLSGGNRDATGTIRLALGANFLYSPTKIALFLHTLWPNAKLKLRRLMTEGDSLSYDSHDDNSHLWQAVQDLLQAFHLSRRLANDPHAFQEILSHRAVQGLDFLINVVDE